MFSIRRATTDDVDILTRLRLQLFRETDYLDGDEPSSLLREATRTYLLTHLPDDRFLAWVAEQEGQIIGMSGLIFFEKPPTGHGLTGREGYIMNMYTVPEWRGKGVATTLLQEIIRFAKAHQVTRLWLRTTQDGQSVYEKSGFTFLTQDMELVW